MKLLFDQNLSSVLVEKLQDLFPGSAHTEALGLARADDSVIWIRRGNCSTSEIAAILRQSASEIHAAADDEGIRYVVLV